MDSLTSNIHHQFFDPVFQLLADCKHYRRCPSLDDKKWVELGVSRVVEAAESGRGFLQNLISRGQYAPSKSHFFETLKSKRRLALCHELNDLLSQQSRSILPDALAGFESLKNFEVRAGDGHWHGASSFDKKWGTYSEDGTRKEKKYPVGHLYTLDLRTHLMRHLMTTDQENKRKEHDMRALKRAGAEGLREGVAKGRKLLMVWDSAAIDFNYWRQLKQGHGVYFICRNKKIPKMACGNRRWDREDPLNHGVIEDRHVESGGNSQYIVRVISFKDRSTSKEHHFVTNEMTLEPGLLAHLYRMRWDIEKVFDEVKNRLKQKKAWANSATAKSMQGHFIALTHNLMLLLSEMLKKEEGISDEEEIKRRRKRRSEENEKAGRSWELIAMRDWLHRSTQRGLKFIRWLRIQLVHRTSWRESCESLTALYARL